jgi:hypothetical protein
MSIRELLEVKVWIVKGVKVVDEAQVRLVRCIKVSRYPPPRAPHG